MWIIFATSAGAILGFGDVFLKSLSRQLKPSVACFGLYFLGMLVWVPILSLTGRSEAFLQSVYLPTDVQLLVLGRSLLQLLAYAPIFLALRILPLSTYSALRALSPVLALSAGILIYGDRPSVTACLGIGAVLLGVVTVSRTDYRRTLSTSGTSYPRRHLTLSYILAISAATCSAIMPIYDKNLLAIAHADGFVLQALSDLYRLGLLLLILLLSGRPAKQFSWCLGQSAKKVSWTLAAAALLIAGGEMLSFYAVSLPGSLPSVVAILRRASLPVSTILGHLVFGETLGPTKMAGIAAVVLGILLINGT